jgi:hypothetical protein
MSTALRRNTHREKGTALYMELIARFPLRPLRSNRELERASKIANALAIRTDLTQGETDYLDVLTDILSRSMRTSIIPSRVFRGSSSFASS